MNNFIVIYMYNSQEYKGNIYIKNDTKSLIGYSAFIDPYFLYKLDIYFISTNNFNYLNEFL